ncbi:MAG: hypothetical protein KGQ45_11930 [Burkholderiales bacterium]|nr:hypothetical protein [Burkholderiales bacterium]
MEIDLLAAVALTASASITVATLAIGFGADVLARARIAVVLAAWFALIVALAATRALHYPDGVGAPGLGLVVLLPPVAIVAYALRSPALRRALMAVPLAALVGVNGVRVLGVLFLVMHAQGRLPAPFAFLAGVGDVLAGLGAASLAWRLYRQKPVARGQLWVWNGFGLADLVNAIALGALSAPGPQQLLFGASNTNVMTTLPWLLIPAFLVPLLACTHLAVFYRLAKSRVSEVRGTGWGRNPKGAD